VKKAIFASRDFQNGAWGGAPYNKGGGRDMKKITAAYMAYHPGSESRSLEKE